MSQPAPVTSRADWDDVVVAIQETVDDIRDNRDLFNERVAEQQGDQQMTDPDNPNADLDDQQLDDERRRRDEELDADADGRVDGNYENDLDA